MMLLELYPLTVLLQAGIKGQSEIYGYSAKEILGKHISILAPPHLDKETKKLSELIKQGRKDPQL